MFVLGHIALAKNIERMNLFSVEKFIAYELIITSIYLIVTCFSNKMYFGKSTRDIIRLIFIFLGRFALIVLSGFIAAILYKPQNLKEIALMGIFSSLISFIILALSNFKKYYFSAEEERFRIVKLVIHYFIIVFLMTTISTYLALR